jgi:trehalose 6-phosphate synthase/phosphatase
MTSDSSTNNIPKPNRVIHISHFIPTICSLSADGKSWDFSVRRGHSAMYAGIQSLSPSYDNIHIGYIGELKDHNNHTIPYSQIDESMKESVKTALLKDKNKQIPVFIDPVEASSHYEGYCKSGKVFYFIT